MTRVLLVLIAVQGCAIDDPQLSTDEAASTYYSGGFEAESGSISGGIHRLTDVGTSSGGAYLSLDSAGYVRYFFTPEVPGATAFVLYARVRAASGSSIGVDVELDGHRQHDVLPITPAWTWVAIVNGSKPYVQHQLRLDVDQPGLQIDRIVYSDGSFVPYTRFYEAETASLVYPMRIASQVFPPPATTYVWAPTGSGTTGRLDLDVGIPSNQDGYCRVWLLANAQSTAHNSLMLGLNAAPSTPYDVPLTSASGYTWSWGYEFWDNGAPQILSVRDIESGVKIDKLMITNDNGFDLVQSSPPLIKTL
jgi:hypothetical protein